MQKFAAAVLVCLAAGAVYAAAPTQGTYIPNAEIQRVMNQNPTAPVADQQIRVIGIDNRQNVGIGVVHRAKTAKQSVGGSSHNDITEVYHVISGSGTLVVGGTLQNAKPRASDSEPVRFLTGPSMEGAAIVGGTSHKIGPGDVIVIPPGTPHTFTEVTSDQIVYLVVRFDPKKVLPAGYAAK